MINKEYNNTTIGNLTPGGGSAGVPKERKFEVGDILNLKLSLYGGPIFEVNDVNYVQGGETIYEVAIVTIKKAKITFE